MSFFCTKISMITLQVMLCECHRKLAITALPLPCNSFVNVTKLIYTGFSCLSQWFSWTKRKSLTKGRHTIPLTLWSPESADLNAADWPRYKVFHQRGLRTSMKDVSASRHAASDELDSCVVNASNDAYSSDASCQCQSEMRPVVTQSITIISYSLCMTV